MIALYGCWLASDGSALISCSHLTRKHLNSIHGHGRNSKDRAASAGLHHLVRMKLCVTVLGPQVDRRRPLRTMS
jgi:hypothetical protein